MSPSGDDSPDMTIIHGDLDEPAIDALVGARGGAVPEFEDVAVLFMQLRGLIDAPAMPPSPDLAAMLAHGLPAARPEHGAQATSVRPGAWRRARRTALAIGLSAVVGIPAMGVAAARDRLPDWAQDMVETLIEATTPFPPPGRESRAEDHASQEIRPSPVDRPEPGPSPAVLQATARPATLGGEEITDGPDGDGTTAAAGSTPQSLDPERADRDASQTTTDPTTRPQPAASSTVAPGGSTTSSHSSTPGASGYPTGATTTLDPEGSSGPTTWPSPTGIPSHADRPAN
jgi:hypothetical protein